MQKQLQKDKKNLTAWCLAAFLCWTVFQLGVLSFYKGSERQIISLLGQELGRSILEKDLTYRAWNSGHGGVYVPIDEKTRPNPYLDHPHKIITAPNGQNLTLINPAYMTRQVHQLGMEMFNTHGHLTSLKVIRPENKAAPWETIALKEFEKGMTMFSEPVEIEDKSYLRVMLPVYTLQSCLACHAEQGYGIGDVRGGISTMVSLEKVSNAVQKDSYRELLFHLVTYGGRYHGISCFLPAESQATGRQVKGGEGTRKTYC